MDSVQESSRCKQTKPSLWPTRPAGRIRDHQARSRVRGCSARGLHGMPHVLSGLAPRPRKPEGRTRNREAGDRPEGITPTGGSAPNEAHTPNRHTRGKDTPGTPTDRSQQYAIGSWQMAVRITQHRKEVTRTCTRPQRHTPSMATPSGRLHRPRRSANPPDRHTPPRPVQPNRLRLRLRLRLDPGRRTAQPAAPTAPQPPPLPLPLSLPPWARRHASPVSPPDPRHTRSRRCQPEPRPTRRLGPAAHFVLRHTGFRRCRLQPDLKPTWSRPATSGNSHLFVAAACSSTENRPGPGQQPRAITRLFVAASLNPDRRPAQSQPDALGQSPASSSLPG